MPAASPGRSAYDTIYAHQDKEDDALIGVKSTALKFGDTTDLVARPVLLRWPSALIDAAIWLAGGASSRIWALPAAAMHAAWQLARFDHANSARCLELFRSNRIFGLIITLGLLLDCTPHMIDELLSLAGEAVSHARKLGADAVHAVAADGRSTEISILDGKIEKVEQSEARDISLKVYAGKSSATISGSVLTQEAIHRLAETAPRHGAARTARSLCRALPIRSMLATDIPDLDLAADDLPDPQGLERWRARPRRQALAVKGVTKSQGAGASRSETSVGIVISNGFAQGYRRTGMGVSHVGHCRRRPRRCSATMIIPPPFTSPTCAIPKPSAAARASAR